MAGSKKQQDSQDLKFKINNFDKPNLALVIKISYNYLLTIFNFLLEFTMPDRSTKPVGL